MISNQTLVCYYYMLKMPKPGEAFDLKTDKGVVVTFDMKTGNTLQKFQKNGIQSGLSKQLIAFTVTVLLKAMGRKRFVSPNKDCSV